MKLLALDTSSLACSVALGVDGDVVNEHAEREREHTALLVPMIRDVLDRAGVQLRNLDAIVLGNGPGSFIGMRIGASVAQGLAHGAGLPIVPVSSLAAVAAESFSDADADETIVAQDAHMNEIYLGRFRRGADDLPEALDEERLHAVAAIQSLDGAHGRRRIAAGFGWRRYPELLALNGDRIGALSEVSYPDARFLLALANPDAAISPENLQPAYLRQQVARKPEPPKP